MTTHSLKPGDIHKGTLAAGNVLRVTADASYTGFAFLNSIEPNGPRWALAASDDVTIGPFFRPMQFRIDVTTGSVTIDGDYRPSLSPLDHIGASAAIEAVRTELLALIEARLSLAQRAAIDVLTEASDAAAIVAALQVVTEPE